MRGAYKFLGMVFLLTVLSSLAVGCTTTNAGKGTYTSDQDAQAVYEMEWNLDPYR